MSYRQIPKGIKTLADNTATGIFEVALPAGGMCGGMITVTVVATDGTDFQSHADIVSYAAVNKAGAYTTDITASNAGDSIAVSSGTLAVSYSIVTGADKITVRVTADSSLTTTSIVAYYQINNIDGHAVTII